MLLSGEVRATHKKVFRKCHGTLWCASLNFLSGTNRKSLAKIETNN